MSEEVDGDAVEEFGGAECVCGGLFVVFELFFVVVLYGE